MGQTLLLYRLQEVYHIRRVERSGGQLHLMAEPLQGEASLMEVILITQLGDFVFHRTDGDVQRFGQILNSDRLACHEQDRLNAAGKRAGGIILAEELLFHIHIAFKIRHAFSSGVSSRRPGYRTISP